MNITELNNKRAQLLNSIADLKKWLPYADHGAYGQDKRRIADLTQQVQAIDSQIQGLSNE